MGLGKVDYLIWLYRLDIQRYIIMRGLNINKLKVKWRVRARKYEVKI